MRTDAVRFEGGTGNALTGLLDMPDSDPSAYALFAHCFTCGKSLAAARNISKMVTAEGIALLRFDFTGLGQSEGEFAETSFATNLTDLAAASDYLGREHQAPALLIGHSLGGTAVLAAAHAIPSSKCVVTIAAPADPVHVRHLIAGADFDESGAAQVRIGGRPFKIGRQFVEDLEKHDLPLLVSQLKRPLMILHSPVDTIVGIDNAEKIFKAASHPKSFVSLGSADHLVSKPEDARFLGHVLSAWAGHYVSQGISPAVHV